MMKTKDESSKKLNKMTVSLLHIAAARGYANEVRQLLRMSNCDVNTVDEEGRTPLMVAANKRHHDVMRLLIETGCDVNTRDCHGNSVLMAAVQEGADVAVKLLLSHDVDVNIRDSRLRTPLHLATLKGSILIVRLLVEAGCHFNVQDEDGYTPLFLAAWDPFNKQLLPVLRTLLYAGANPDVCDVTNRAPITAAWSKWRHLVCLVQSGCDVNNVRMNGYSLLLVACFENDVTKLNLLKMAGARMDYSILESAAVKGHSARYELLRDIVSNPLSLQALSRVRARALIHRPFMANVDKLALPLYIKSYLKMEEFYPNLTNGS